MKNKEVLIIQDEIVISQEDHDLILEPGDQVRVLPADEDFGVIDEPYPDEEYEDEFINEPIIVEEPEIENEYGIIIPAEGYVGDEDDLYDGFDDYEVEEDDDEVLGDYHDVANVDNVPVDIENDLYDLENSKIVVVHEDVRIKQDGHDIILERGDIMKIEKKSNIIEIREEVRIPQGNQELILEKGDRIQIIKEDQTIIWKDFLGMKLLAHERLSEFVFEVPYQKIKVEGSYVSCMLLGKSLHMKFKNKIDTFTLTPDPSDVVTIYEDDNYGFKIELRGLGGVFYGYY